jgi:hypothetical protein
LRIYFLLVSNQTNIKTMNKIAFLFVSLLFLASCINKNPVSTPNADSTTGTLTGRTADYNEDKNAYFGDLHVHTSWSFDAFIYNVRTTPEDAYKFGKGGAIAHVDGKPIQLSRPLDFMAVSDHAEYMGVLKMMLDPNSPISKLEMADNIRNPDPVVSRDAFSKIGTSLARNQPIADLTNKEINQSTWKRIVEIANQYNEPGKFTTFAAYEWTSSPTAGDDKLLYARNLHRNVIYKSDNVSDMPFTSFDSQNPEKLWEWMDKERAKGIELLAIPHNSNMSDGIMYDLTTYDSKPLTKAYADTRMRNEPISEVSQIKGTSMTHPALSKNDEFANFEIYEYTFSTSTPPKSKPQGSYVQQALKDGLAIEQKVGSNPYKFGFIGSSDGHNSASPVEENKYFGKLGVMDSDAKRRMNQEEEKFLRYKEMSSGGLAGVWAEENTRDAIYNALARKEVFATSGTRIKVRMFGGWDFQKDIFKDEKWLKKAYANGVPMGSDLKNNSKGKAPNFIIQAVKDAEGANLDRVQVIKGWIDANGKTHEKIFNVAWSDRKMNADGSLPPVGNTVNIADASYTNSIGAISLQTVWTDPEFDPKVSAFYYVRVLEIPTPRWSTFDAKDLHMQPIEDLAPTIQERAWSSPIWYNR